MDTDRSSFVQGLQRKNAQLTQALQEIYTHMQNGSKMILPVETNEKGQPQIHRILDRLGLLDPDDEPEIIVFDTPGEAIMHVTRLNNREPTQVFRQADQTPPITPPNQNTSFFYWDQVPQRAPHAPPITPPNQDTSFSNRDRVPQRAPHAPPITPSNQETSFSNWDRVPRAVYEMEHARPISQNLVEEQIRSNTVPFSQTSQTDPGLMFSMPSPAPAYNALGRESNTSFNPNLSTSFNPSFDSNFNSSLNPSLANEYNAPGWSGEFYTFPDVSGNAGS